MTRSINIPLRYDPRKREPIVVAPIEYHLDVVVRYLANGAACTPVQKYGKVMGWSDADGFAYYRKAKKELGERLVEAWLYTLDEKGEKRIVASW